ncbi:phage portal protein [Caenibius sp. WL]|uniref:phage portal protein n=1 Tax=Caenibius sp. WL TaxID=2872646 RepID=UPI001C9A079B|nr:phage portal protein [Caenibius sp. WL]QZP08193.1 phage portal protein [Caenibius sp. WL]
MSSFLGTLTAALSPRGVPLSPPDDRGGWWPIVRESFAGAWQQNVTVDQQAVLAFHAVFACMTLIANDIAKLRVKLVAKDSDGIWSETENAAYSPVLRKPNDYQTRIQFWEHYILSKLSRGNTYVLKVRDNRRVVTKLHVLDPDRVQPLVAPDGNVYYALQCDNIAGLTEPRIVVPANEIIHDRFNCLFHPLVGISPIFASGLAATQGLNIQKNSASLFANASQPGGLLIAPGNIDQANADRLKAYWEANYTGQNAGKIAVLGDGMEYKALNISPVDAQLIEQLKWTAEVVCSTFHMPPYKIGVGTMPTYNNIQALNVEYYSQCLQSHIEAAEVCLDDGLGTGERLGTEFDTKNLLRMDSVTQMQVLRDGVNGGIMAPDEARADLDLKPKRGGDTPYLQQQNYSLEALAKRDARDDPFAKDASVRSNATDDVVKALLRLVGDLQSKAAQSEETELEQAFLYQGVYEQGRKYERGQFVTRGGSMWHCKRQTTETPGESPDHWQLAVKKGRDGKDTTR